MALEIKDGLSYMDASGNEIGPMEFDNRTSTSYVWDCLKTGRSYTRDGKYMENGSDPHLNLVSEIRPSIESPIRTVTRRIISRGEYGCVKIGKHELSTNTLAVEMVCTEKGFMRSADELRSAAMVLSQLAEFLDEDKGVE